MYSTAAEMSIARFFQPVAREAPEDEQQEVPEDERCEEATKVCTGPNCLGITRPLAAFNRNSGTRDGLQTRCRDCQRVLWSQHLERKRAESVEPETTGSASSADAPPAKRHASEQWLYVMASSFDLDGAQWGLKIGRAVDVDARAQALGTSQPFKLVVLVRYRGLGYLEHRLHEIFARQRVDSGSGREWFRVKLADIMRAVLAMEPNLGQE